MKERGGSRLTRIQHLIEGQLVQPGETHAIRERLKLAP
jgi:hypothetical protein